MRAVRTLAGALGLLLCCSPALAEKGKTVGTFTDAAGKPHPWQITRSHTLLWEGQPYLPAGVVFRSRFLASPSEESFAADRAALERLRGAGVQDLWVDPGRGLLGCRPDETQRLLDALESLGFRYGLAVSDRSARPIHAYQPPPDGQSVPAVALQPGARFQWSGRVPECERVHFALCAAESDWVLAAGTVPAEHGLATVDVRLKNSRLLGKTRGILYLIPERRIPADEVGTFADLWGGMAGYEKDLVAYLKGLRFGAGFRFLLDPFEAASAVDGAETAAFPATDEFRAGFADWMRRGGLSIAEVNTRWGTTQTRIDSLEIAARLVPTWQLEDPPALGWLVDPVGGAAYQVVPTRSRIWDDYLTCRADSIQRAMSQLAASIKAAGPDAPVIYTWNGFQPLFATGRAAIAFDGIAPILSGRGQALATAGGAHALAQAEQSAQSWWLVAGRLTRDAAGSLAEDWQTLRDLGFKGLFLDGKEEALDVPALKGAAENLALDRDLATYLPKVCFFPAYLPNAGRVTRLPNGVWWLPSVSQARLLRLGDKLSGYHIAEPFGDQLSQVKRGLILWSPTGARQTTFYADPHNPVVLLDSAGKPMKVRPRGQVLKITLSDTPVIAMGLDDEKAMNLVFPVEASVALIQEFDSLLKLAESKGIDTKAARQMHRDAVKMLTPATAGHVYQLVSKPVAGLRDLFSPYLWVEGERPLDHSFSGSLFRTGTSEGRILQLDRSRAPRDGAFTARYTVVVHEAATYELWVAGSAPGKGGTSPLRWNMDGDPAAMVESATASEEYAPGLAWYSLGQVTLTKGKHVLTLAVPARGAADEGRYRFAVDAFVLARAPFQPRGTEKPDW